MSIARTSFGKERGSLVLILIPVLMLMIGGAVLGWVWWSRSAGNTSELVVGDVVKPMPIASASVQEMCVQMIAPAIDPATGQCREFATPCDVPKTFLSVETCAAEAFGWLKYSPRNGVFGLNFPSGWDFSVRQTSIEVLGFTNLITQVAFDDKESGRRNPFGELLGRIELSWLGSGNYESKSVEDFVLSYYRNGEPMSKPMKVGELEVVRVEHKNCGENKGCIDYVFKHEKVFYVLRALRSGDKTEDEKIMLTMLYSWKFLDR